MVWKCPPLNLFNWSNLWKWKADMNLTELIDALDQRYGNPHAVKECGLIQQATEELRRLKKLEDEQNEKCTGK